MPDPKAPVGLVRGGTTTAAWDAMKARQYRQSDARRAKQDRAKAINRKSQQFSCIRSDFRSFKLLSRANPQVVITYRQRDRALDRQAVCEIFITPWPERPGAFQLVMTLVCPKCMERTGRQDDSQVIIQQSHRMWWLDETKPGTFTHPEDGSFHRIAGTVTTQDVCKCAAQGCQWSFRIDDSVLREV